MQSNPTMQDLHLVFRHMTRVEIDARAIGHGVVTGMMWRTRVGSDSYQWHVLSNVLDGSYPFDNGAWRKMGFKYAWYLCTASSDDGTPLMEYAAPHLRYLTPIDDVVLNDMPQEEQHA